jgi:Zn-dependent M28 family amino/carboxypeptidase
LGALGACVSGSGAAGEPPAPSAAALMADMRFLADDRVEGRGTMTRGHELAALYVATQLEAAGLEPAGSDGSFFQQVPLRAARLVESESSFEWQRGGRYERLLYGDDFVLQPNFHGQQRRIEAGIVFAGFCVSAPELKHDDLAKLELRGRIVACLFGAPRTFSPDQRAHYGQANNKARVLAERGAAGVLVVRQAQAEQAWPWAKLRETLRQPSLRWLDGDVPVETFPGLGVAGVLSQGATRRLFAWSGRDLEATLQSIADGRFQGFDTGVRARVRTVSRWTDGQSPNVAGLLRGSDSQASAQVLVVSAHLDHLGQVEPAPGGDGIYNGAYDNASGVAAVLALARAFAQTEPRPRRSLLFLFVTGEERGLLGSDYFARRPTRTGLVGNVNLDGILMLCPTKDVITYGAEHSSLGPALARAAAAEGLTVSPDPWPEQGVFVRSDHYSFVRQGLPAVMLVPGFTGSRADCDAAARSRQWLARVYHTPQDDLSQPFDLEAGLRVVAVARRLVSELADAPEPPAWVPGDFFGTLFQPQPAR